MEKGENPINFELRGKTYRAFLRGRNEDLVIGFSKNADKAIAVRCILDGDATPKISGKKI